MDKVKWGKRIYLYLLCRALLLAEACWFLPWSQRPGWTCMFTRKQMNCTCCRGSADRKTCTHFSISVYVGSSSEPIRDWVHQADKVLLINALWCSSHLGFSTFLDEDISGASSPVLAENALGQNIGNTWETLLRKFWDAVKVRTILFLCVPMRQDMFYRYMYDIWAVCISR